VAVVVSIQAIVVPEIAVVMAVAHTDIRLLVVSETLLVVLVYKDLMVVAGRQTTLPTQVLVVVAVLAVLAVMQMGLSAAAMVAPEYRQQ
jgi:hypothetical protein